MQDLALTGFPTVGDGDLGEAGAAAGGVEEVTAINLLQVALSRPYLVPC